MTRSFVDIFSEGGPFIIAEEAAFRAWPGARGWDATLAELAAPGGVVERDGARWIFFDPEDPGPALVGWTGRSLIVARWSSHGQPVRLADLDEAGRVALDAALARSRAEAPEIEELGTVELTDGVLVIAWAAYGGADLVDERAAVEALASTEPRQTRRYRGGGPGLTAVRVPPGRYAVRAAFEQYDDAGEVGGSWLALDPA
ncbi:MAG: hypothetical protein KC464_26450 [Myxococcales bacterium]|nr:hypothetical protein [Myxococcales bacterium]